jgi:hypothetical protein
VGEFDAESTTAKALWITGRCSSSNQNPERVPLVVANSAVPLTPPCDCRERTNSASKSNILLKDISANKDPHAASHFALSFKCVCLKSVWTITCPQWTCNVKKQKRETM